MTRARLLDIAVREFGARGLDGAATRDIAAAAGTAMSSITYHYGGKEGLYLAAADHIANHMAQEMAPALAAEDEVGEGDAEAARVALHRLIGRLVDRMGEPDAGGISLFLQREQLQPSDAFERIWAGIMGQMTRRLADLVRAATGATLPVARLATLTLLGQAMGVRASRAAVLRLCELDEVDPETLTRLKARIDSNIDAILDRMVAEEQQ
ncbi:CerR family C-terminal domain-containing protein [Sphingomonas bacterium]|uniref:CerR family C-terminal domain-containing protein n=1 Tax=Sphingomonas bacterium TaxID=1895847 RepID=UPI0015755D4C|nr:CerR family C-terminal domain-containing protein [Sphingomonas bacterium]